MTNFLTRGANQITGKPWGIFKFNLPTNAQTLPAANIQTLKLYRDICRKVPYLLKINQRTHEVHSTTARILLAEQFRKNAYIRDLSMINSLITSGYETLQESVWLYNHYHNFSPSVIPQRTDALGLNFLEQEKLKGTSEFLKKFYGGYDRPNV